MRIEAIDLFCGAGGLTRGLLDAGIEVKAGFDLDGSCKHAYEANNPGAKFFHKNVTKVKGSELKKLWSPGAIRLLAGCAPCQPFSTAANGARAKAKDENTVDDQPDESAESALLPVDHRYDLLDEFARLVRTCRPEIVTMENVPRVKNHAPFLRFVAQLKQSNYDVWYRAIQCTEVGVPQTRRRLVLLASRIGVLDRQLLKSPDTPPLTVEAAIGDLRALEAGGRDPEDPIHFARTLSEVNLSRIKASTPGGSWEEWPDELRSACHKKDSGQSYKSVYARMSPDRPAPTITTQFFNFGTGRFGHPTQHRALTPREAAILQSFPPHYEFFEKGQDVYLNVLGRMIGNAVPPKLGEAIGRTIVQHVKTAKKRRAAASA